MKALVGHTGFVGSNLLAAGGYDATFNSKNFRDMAGGNFDELVCAGVSAAKWIANREPEADRAAIKALTDTLAKARIGRFVLVSTIDVYPDSSSREDESADLSGRKNHAYGTHRLELEQWVRGRYPEALIVRLPGLYGRGLKKNAIYDLLNDNELGSINPASVFQWYGVGRLARDLEAARRAKLKLVNLFTAPLPMAEIIAAHFPAAPVGAARQPAPRYDLRTQHAELFGGGGPYIESADQVRAGIAAYVRGAR
jgi:nucleoside-diphosphate-sugar epimerase